MSSPFGIGNAVLRLTARTQSPTVVNPITGNPATVDNVTEYRAKITASSSSSVPPPGEGIPKEAFPITGRLTEPLQWNVPVNRLPQEIEAIVDDIPGKLYLSISMRSYWGVDEIIGAKISGYFYPI
jgi:hypothetical protein